MKNGFSIDWDNISPEVAESLTRKLVRSDYDRFVDIGLKDKFDHYKTHFWPKKMSTNWDRHLKWGSTIEAISILSGEPLDTWIPGSESAGTVIKGARVIDLGCGDSQIPTIAHDMGAEYSLGGDTSLEGSIFYNNNVTSAMNETHALFHQIGLRVGFLF